MQCAMLSLSSLLPMCKSCHLTNLSSVPAAGAGVERYYLAGKSTSKVIPGQGALDVQDMQAAKTPDGRLLAVFTLRLPLGNALASRPVLYVHVPAACNRSAQNYCISCAGLTALPGLPHAPFLRILVLLKDAVQAEDPDQSLQ